MGHTDDNAWAYNIIGIETASVFWKFSLSSGSGVVKCVRILIFRIHIWFILGKRGGVPTGRAGGTNT